MKYHFLFSSNPKGLIRSRTILRFQVGDSEPYMGENIPEILKVMTPVCNKGDDGG